MRKLYWKIRVGELERENKHLKIRLDQYEADATALIEEHGCDPDDKIDREVLKHMLNCLIGKNAKLEAENKRLTKFAISILGDVSVQEFERIVKNTLNFVKLQVEIERLKNGLQKIVDHDIRHFHSSRCVEMKKIAIETLKG